MPSPSALSSGKEGWRMSAGSIFASDFYSLVLCSTFSPKIHPCVIEAHNCRMNEQIVFPQFFISPLFKNVDLISLGAIVQSCHFEQKGIHWRLIYELLRGGGREVAGNKFIAGALPFTEHVRNGKWV